MSRDGSGNYTLPSGNPPVTGTTITVTWADTTLSDVAVELTASLNRSGKGAMLAPLKLYDGAIGAPGLTFSGETNSGWYRASSGNIRFSLEGADLITLDNTATASTITYNTTITNGDVVTYYAVSATAKFLMGYVGTAGRLINDTAAGDCIIRTQGLPLRISVNSGTSSAMVLSATGALSIAAPSSTDTPLTLTSASTARALSVSNGTVNGVMTYTATPSLQFGVVTNHPLELFTNNSVRVTIPKEGGIKTTAVAVTSLPAANTVGIGTRHFATDATATTFASIVAGGGANAVPVYSDGTNWRIG
jgi:hypothetical protein